MSGDLNHLGHGQINTGTPEHNGQGQVLLWKGHGSGKDAMGWEGCHDIYCDYFTVVGLLASILS